jgi:hypothetical protein
VAAAPVIDRFVPPAFSWRELDLTPVQALLGKPLHYAANGRSALLHIALAHPQWRKMLVPTYVCASVLIPLRKAGIEPVFYDLDSQDLNGDLASLEQQATRHGVPAVLLPSMYGNPADLQQAQALCQRLGLFLIDDAAQSFGASLDGRPVGSFGNAGFFSCSPGKPLAGPMGALYWADQVPEIRRTRHDAVHYLKWLDFRIRRLNAYANLGCRALHPLLEYGTVAVTKLLDTSLDAMAPFESQILGGLLHDALEGRFAFRQQHFDAFAKRFGQSRHFALVRALRGKPCNHKIVLRCNSRELAAQLREFLAARRIYSSAGYPLLSRDNPELKHAAQIDGCIVELPIEEDAQKMRYLSDAVQKFHDDADTD